jgi:hypothetical protein
MFRGMLRVKGQRFNLHGEKDDLTAAKNHASLYHGIGGVLVILQCHSVCAVKPLGALLYNCDTLKCTVQQSADLEDLGVEGSASP